MGQTCSCGIPSQARPPSPVEPRPPAPPVPPPPLPDETLIAALQSEEPSVALPSISEDPSGASLAPQHHEPAGPELVLLRADAFTGLEAPLETASAPQEPGSPPKPEAPEEITPPEKVTPPPQPATPKKASARHALGADTLLPLPSVAAHSHRLSKDALTSLPRAASPHTLAADVVAAPIARTQSPAHSLASDVRVAAAETKGAAAHALSADKKTAPTAAAAALRSAAHALEQDARVATPAPAARSSAHPLSEDSVVAAPSAAAPRPAHGLHEDPRTEAAAVAKKAHDLSADDRFAGEMMERAVAAAHRVRDDPVVPVAAAGGTKGHGLAADQKSPIAARSPARRETRRPSLKLSRGGWAHREDSWRQAAESVVDRTYSVSVPSSFAPRGNGAGTS